MYKSTKAFLEAFRQVVDNQLLAYEEEVIKAFEREVREHRERFEELPDYKMFDEGSSALSDEACV